MNLDVRCRLTKQRNLNEPPKLHHIIIMSNSLNFAYYGHQNVCNISAPNFLFRENQLKTTILYRLVTRVPVPKYGAGSESTVILRDNKVLYPDRGC
jgi:hypothetical protein